MVYLSRIYTKTGDQGETGLGDGSRVAKDHPRVAACGGVDELNAVLGLLLAGAPDLEPGTAALLRGIQNDLFDVGADLCVPQAADEKPGQKLRIQPEHATRLEAAIDHWNSRLQPLKSFILPGALRRPLGVTWPGPFVAGPSATWSPWLVPSLSTRTSSFI